MFFFAIFHVFFAFFRVFMVYDLVFLKNTTFFTCLLFFRVLKVLDFVEIAKKHEIPPKINQNAHFLILQKSAKIVNFLRKRDVEITGSRREITGSRRRNYANFFYPKFHFKNKRLPKI